LTNSLFNDTYETGMLDPSHENLPAEFNFEKTNIRAAILRQMVDKVVVNDRLHPDTMSMR